MFQQYFLLFFSRIICVFRGVDGKCASRSNVYPYTSCCVLDIHFVLKNNFRVNLFDGNLILLCILFVFFLDICTILFILCKKNKQTKQNN